MSALRNSMPSNSYPCCAQQPRRWHTNPSGQPEVTDGNWPYAPGDSVKNIMWKVYARSRQLNVRLPEHSVFQAREHLPFSLPVKTTKPQLLLQELRFLSGALGETGLWCRWLRKTNFRLCRGTVGYCRVERAETASCLWVGSVSRPGGRNQPATIVFTAAAPHVNLQNLRKTFATIPTVFPDPALTACRKGRSHRGGRPYATQENLIRTHLSKPGYRAELLDLLTEIGQQVESTVVIDRETGLGFDRFLRKV